MTACICPEPGYCPRHRCRKTPHWHKLCRRRQDYFELWEAGRGPGQAVGPRTSPQTAGRLTRILRWIGLARLSGPKVEINGHGAGECGVTDETTSRESLAVIIPACDAVDLTCRCLDNLALHGDVPLQIVYVDNGSRADAPRQVAAHAERLGLDLCVIRNSTNIGFTAAVNQGIRAAGRRHVLVLNNDCFIGPGCLSRMLAQLKERVAAVGPVTGDDGSQSLRRTRIRSRVGVSGEIDESDPIAGSTALAHNCGRSMPADRLSFFCTLLSAEALREFGPLDERLAQLGSDDEWCARGRKSGWKIRVAMDAYAAHLHKSSFRRLGLDRAALQREALRRLAQQRRQPACVLVMPVFNRLEYVRKSLESVLQQDYPALRIVVWDNGSDSATEEYLRRRLADEPRATLIRSPRNMGCIYPQAVVWGRFANSVELLAKIDSDILAPPDYIARLADACLASDRLGVMGAFHFGADAETWINPQRIESFGRRSLVRQKHVGGCCMLRADVYRQGDPIPCEPRCADEPFSDGSFTVYQQQLQRRGLCNGYPLPLVHIEQMEDIRSEHCVQTDEYETYKVRMRGRTQAQMTNHSWIHNAKKYLG